MEIDEATVKNLVHFNDGIGVLSIYTGQSPAEISAKLKDLVASCAAKDPKLAKQIEKCAAAVESEFTEVFSARNGNTGHAMFVGVESGMTREITMRMPFRNEVTFDKAPCLRQLLAAQGAGRSCGIVNVSESGMSLSCWSFGEASTLFSREFTLDERSSATRGHGADADGTGFRGDDHKDRFDHHAEQNYGRFLNSCLEEVLATARAANWDRVLVAGPAKQRSAAIGCLNRDPNLRVLSTDRSLENENMANLAATVWPILHDDQATCDGQLIASAKDRALGGGLGALGATDVCEALNQGRVAHLVVHDDIDLRGFCTPQGTLHPVVRGAVAESDQPVTYEPALVDRMLEAAINTHALTTVITADEGLVDLRQHEGVAAILRW